MGVLKTLEKNLEINKDNIYISKKELRKSILQIRDGLSLDERTSYSKIISDKILEWNVYRECEALLIYVNFRSEADTHEIIKNALMQHKKVYCPKVIGDDMLFYQISSLNDLESGYMGIKEPVEGLDIFDYKGDNILMIMPGSVFDKAGNRIGYGKGYYDRFLAECHRRECRPVTTAIAFSVQMVENIPTESHDYKTDYIFNEKETIKI